VTSTSWKQIKLADLMNQERRFIMNNALMTHIFRMSDISISAKWTGYISGLLLFVILPSSVRAAGNSSIKPLFHSFEDSAELADWRCQPGITTELTSQWASEGKTALQINVPSGTPWFGVQRDVKLEELRRHEFLEFDLHAVTNVDYAAFKMHSDRFQDLMANHDRLKPGETIHVRIRLTDNEIVRFGDVATISIWMANDTPSAQIILVDNIRLTGFGGEAAKLDDLRSRIKASNAASPETASILADCEAKLVSAVTAEDVGILKARWRAILAGELDTAARYHTVSMSPLQKVRRGDTLADLEIDPRERGIRIAMARNEYETRQLVVLPKSLDGEVWLEVSAGDLKGPQSAVIPAADIELRMVDEIGIAGTTQFPGEQLVGDWPDPLLPNAPFQIKEGRLQSVWLTVRSRGATPPGDYEGTISISDREGVVTTLPLAVTVWDFALPERSSLKSHFNPWSHNWATFYNYAKYPRGTWLTAPCPAFEDIPREQQLAAIEFFANYRATLQGMNTAGMIAGKPVPPVLQSDGSLAFEKAPKPDSPTWDEVAVAAMKNDGSLFVGEIGGQTKLHLGEASKVAEAAGRYLGEVSRHASKRAWKGPLYCYMLDEPHLHPDRGGWTAVLKEAQFLKSIAPEIKTFVASGVFLPTPKQSLLYRDIDAFCVLWDRTPVRDAEFLRTNGKEVWWYGANVTDAPYPNWAVQTANAAPRMIPLLSYKFKMDGVLNWAATLFNDDNSYPQDGPRWPARPWSMKGWYYKPGEGHLCYPGTGGNFWPSIRLSNWRDGMEDYEYLKLLEQRLLALPADKQEIAKELLSLGTLVSAPYDYSRDPADFADLRRHIAGLLTQENGSKENAAKP
jgi:hypothetical protein